MEKTPDSDAIRAELETVYREQGWQSFTLAAKLRGLSTEKMLAIYRRIRPSPVRRGLTNLLNGTRGNTKGGNPASRSPQKPVP